MKKREYLRPSIRKFFLGRQKGQIQLVTGLFFIIFLSILLYSQLQLMQYRITGLYLEDALAASNLASAVIDIEEYGISHEIQIKDPWQAYERYCQALKGNLNLNDAWECPNKQTISGVVVVLNYTIYNVHGTDVTVYSVTPNGGVMTYHETLGQAKAPNGKLIEKTSVYSEISFPVKIFNGTQVEARKGKLVDVVGEG